MTFENEPELHAIPLFDKLESNDIDSITSMMEQRTFLPGEFVVRQGEVGQSVWLLVEGRCEVTKEVSKSGSAHVVKLTELTPFETFGEMTLFSGLPRSASVAATTEVKALKLSQEEFTRLAQSNPAVGVHLASNMVSIVSRRLQRMDDWLTDTLHVGEAAPLDDQWSKIRRRLQEQSPGHLL